ncbi:MAG: VanZ family protein [Fervidobacterium sp.]
MKSKYFTRNPNKFTLFLLLAISFILWTFVIFYFSSKPPEISSMQSHFIYRILKKLDSIIDFSSTHTFQNLETKIKMWWFKTQYVPAEMIIRKTAHFGLYFILGILSFLLFYVWKRDVVIALLLGVSLPGILAVFDEYNQLFYNRGSSLNDVMIDIYGAFFGVVLSLIVGWTYKLIKKLVEHYKNFA